MSKFRHDPEFPIGQIDHNDTRFRSRLDMERIADNVAILRDDIAARGQIDPVGIARLMGEDAYILIYGFTRAAAIRQLGWTAIKANVYDSLPEQEARILNAANNSMREDLNPWERALQIKNLYNAGIPIDSQDVAQDTIIKLMKMSRRSVFDWLRVVKYDCPELHKAVASDKVTLRHALEFVDYEPEVTRPLIDVCIGQEWTSSELKLRLQSAAMHAGDAFSGKSMDEGATLHSEDESSDKDNSNSITMHCENGNGCSRTIESLRRASTWLMRVSEDDIASMDIDRKQLLHDGLKMVIQAIAVKDNAL